MPFRMSGTVAQFVSVGVGMWGPCYVVQHWRRRSPWELSQLYRALQVVSGLEKVTLSWALIKISLPR